MAGQGVMRMRLERLADRRQVLRDDIAETIRLVEADSRMVSVGEEERLNRRRDELKQIEGELIPLAEDLERIERSMEISKLVRGSEQHEATSGVYRTFAQYARDQMIVRFPQIAAAAGGDASSVAVTQELANERLFRTVQNTTSTNVAGLVQEGGFGGAPWAPLAFSTSARKARLGLRPNTLQATGALKQAASRPSRRTTARSLTLTIEDPKLGFHQEGGANLPARPLIFDTLPLQAEMELEGAAEEYVRDLLDRF